MEETTILKYISAWNWHLLAIISLFVSFVMFALPRTITTSSFYVALFLIFVICEYMALKRKKEVQE